MRAVAVRGGAITTAALSAGRSLDAPAFAEFRRRMVFDWCKWDPQIEDQGAMAPFPLILSRNAWTEVSQAAERLYAETVSAELEIAARPELQGQLGLGRSLWRALADGRPQPGPRVIRFDFHLTTDGWAISEANSDVPGGLIEAAGLAACYAQLGQTDGLTLLARPAEHVGAIFARHPGIRNVALVHASAYTDDRQVMKHLSRVLLAHGVVGHVVAPDALSWLDSRCALNLGGRSVEIDALYRFFPVEWLTRLGRGTQWRQYFTNGLLQLNPTSAAFTQSKRFPLVWDRLRTPLPTWRALLPETTDPRRTRLDDGWVLKPALGRVGEDVLIAGITGLDDAAKIRRHARWFPGSWAVQRRFEAVAIATEQGPAYPVIGVFVIDGKACGVYGRVASRALVDKMARDCAVFVQADADDTPGKELGGDAS